MPFELIKTNIKERKETGSGQTQVLVEGDVIVPDIKSDIMELMKVQGNCYLTEEKPLEDKVGVKGCLHIEVLYAAKKSEKPVQDVYKRQGGRFLRPLCSRSGQLQKHVRR